MNFSDLGKMKDMMASAKTMQEQLERKLMETRVQAESGGGMVVVTMNGKKELLSLTIEPTAMGANASDLELLQELILSAVNDAGRRVDDAMKSNVTGILGELNLPNLPGLS